MTAQQARYAALLVLLVALASAGCTFFTENDDGQVDLGVQAKTGRYAHSAAVRDTIGAHAILSGLMPLRVRGYGVVVGLGDKGSRNCPKAIYDQVLQNLYKRRRTSGMEVTQRSISPERLLDDMDTAVVVVDGAVPPGAAPGTLFDVSVRAVPGTDTTSLRGGRLFTAELRNYHRSASGMTLTGKVLAKAVGPIFVNPFVEGDSAAGIDARRGLVLGGGRATASRPINLVLTEKSFAIARRIQDRINTHFPSRRHVADAQSASLIELRIPREYQDSVGHFVSLVRCLYLEGGPAFEAVRTGQLAEEMSHPDAPHATIALALEGLGRSALPNIQPLYASPKEYVGFHTAVAGIRLGDHIAADRMALIAGDASSTYRFQAIRALGEARGMAGAGMALRSLLGDDDPRVQIAAYEALRARHDVAVESYPIGDDNFVLDIVPSARTHFVYARRKGARRLALFGGRLTCRPPVLYQAPDGIVTLSARTGDQHLSALRRLPVHGRMSPPVEVPLDVEQLIELLGGTPGVDEEGRVTGLNLDYGTIVHALYMLCKDGAIPAEFVLEQPNQAELFGPARPSSRRESEL